MTPDFVQHATEKVLQALYMVVTLGAFAVALWSFEMVRRRQEGRERQRLEGGGAEIEIEKLRQESCLPLATEIGLFRTFGATQGGARALNGRIRERKRVKLARPYICRLIVLRRLICPSTWPLLHAVSMAA